MTIVCPCCGTVMDKPPDIKSLAYLPLSLNERTLVRILIERYPRYCLFEDIANELWGAEGEVQHEREAVANLVTRTRDKLKIAGWTIPSNTGGRGAVALYKLTPLRT